MPNNNTNEAQLKLLSDKIAQLLQERAQAMEEQSRATDPIDSKKKELLVSAAGSKIEAFYLNIMKLLPAEKREGFHSQFKEEYKQALGDKNYRTFLNNVESDTEYLTTREMKDNFLFYKCPVTLINRGLYEKFLTEVAKEIDGNQLEEAIAKIDDYLAPETNNLPVYYLKDSIEKIKEQNREKGLDKALLEELDKELDLIANMVITSSEEYCRAQDKFDDLYDSKNNQKNDEALNEALKKDEYKHVAEYFSLNSNGLHNCVRHVKKEHHGNTQIYKDVQDEKLRFEVPQKTQEVLRKILGFMHERGMIEKGAEARENGTKAYGFTQIAKATNALNEAILTTDVQLIRQARLNYEQALENMREVYKMIEELEPTVDMFVGNLSSYREPWVPAEFKNNIIINALASGIYNLGVSLNNSGISLDELFENPNKTLIKVIDQNVNSQSPNELLKNHTIAFNMLSILEDPIDPHYPMMAVARNVELLLHFSYNSPVRERNEVAALFLQSYDVYADYNVRSSDVSAVSGYAHKNDTLTLANIFLVNDADRDYDKLRAFESYTLNGEKKIPAFNTFEYVQTHMVDPTAMVERIQSTFAEIMQSKNPAGHAKNIAKIVKGAQIAAYEYLMAHPTPDAGFDEKSYDQLKKMVFEPKKAFENLYAVEKIKTAIEKGKPMKDFVANIEQQGNKVMSTYRKSAHDAEKAYNQTANSLISKIASLNEKIENGESVEENTQALETAKNQLTLLKNNELKRLNEAYCNGQLPKDYFDNRSFNVENDKHNEVSYFGVSEYPKFSKFKKQFADDIKNKEISLEEVEFLYKRMIDNAKMEENKLYLINAKIQQFPKLEANEVEAKLSVEEPKIVREKLVVEELKNENHSHLSQKQQPTNPQKINVKEP